VNDEIASLEESEKTKVPFFQKFNTLNQIDWSKSSGRYQFNCAKFGLKYKAEARKGSDKDACCSESEEELEKAVFDSTLVAGYTVKGPIPRILTASVDADGLVTLVFNQKMRFN